MSSSTPETLRRRWSVPIDDGGRDRRSPGCGPAGRNARRRTRQPLRGDLNLTCTECDETGNSRVCGKGRLTGIDGRLTLIELRLRLHAEGMEPGIPPRLPIAVRGLGWCGARKLARWVRQTAGGPAGQGAAAGLQYDAVLGRVSWPPNPVLRWHLAGYLLPGVALYRGLQAVGRLSEQAAEAIAAALERDTQPRRRRLERRGRRRGFLAAFAVMVRGLSRLLYPSPGWQIDCWRRLAT